MTDPNTPKNTDDEKTPPEKTEKDLLKARASRPKWTISSLATHRLGKKRRN